VPTPVPTLEQAVAPTEALRRPARPGLPVGLVLAGLAVLGLIVAAVLGVALWRRGHVEAPVAEVPPAPAATPSAAGTPELPPPSSSAALATGALRVESEPSGARVRVNGQPRGQTPLALEQLALGDYDVRVDARGYDGQSRRVALTAEAPAAEVRVKLQRSAPVTGSAEILSTPPGATVTIDGKLAGRTPLSIPALPAGSRTVQLELEGHEPWSGPVDVAAGQKGRVDVRLRALPKAAPVPTPEVVDPAQVYADTEVDTKPRRVSGNTPSYPSRAPRLRSGERVSVVLMFVVTEAGEVQDVRVMESGGKLLDEIVVAAVKSWRYEPGTKRGTKVKVRTAFKQTFLGG
jgi:TonB family protein